jgi:hypothetical protein
LNWGFFSDAKKEVRFKGGSASSNKGRPGSKKSIEVVENPHHEDESGIRG